MGVIITDVMAGFISALFLLPVVLVIEWKAKSVLLWSFVVFPVAMVCGLLSYLTYFAFGVNSGIVSGPGPRDLGMRITLLIGLILGSAFCIYVLKPIAYKLLKKLK